MFENFIERFLTKNRKSDKKDYEQIVLDLVYDLYYTTCKSLEDKDLGFEEKLIFSELALLTLTANLLKICAVDENSLVILSEESVKRYKEIFEHLQKYDSPLRTKCAN